MFRILPLTTALVAAAWSAQDFNIGSGVPVNIVVTAETQKGAIAQHFTKEDVLVSQSKQHLLVSAFEPVHSLQLWLLIDDGTDQDLGLQFGDLRKFMLAQPATTQFGVGYIRNGMIAVTQALTADHERAAKALRTPTGPPGISASPYIAVNDLVHHWPSNGQAREVLVIGSGIDADYGPGPVDPYLDEAVDAAQRAGVIFYSIYYPGMGHFGHAYFETYWGQYNLGKLSDETGGEFCWQGNIKPVSLAPYLDDLNHRLNNQYLLTFLATAGNKAGFQRIKLATEVPHVSLVGPTKVYVPLGK